MANSFKKLMRQQIQENVDQFSRMAPNQTPPKGWLRAIREALGISTHQLAKKFDRSQSNILQQELREKNGTITLRALEEAAAQLHCKLVYCLVPEKPLEKILEDQARLKAKKEIALINHSMALEMQGLTAKHLEQQEENLVQELLQGNPRKLWDIDDN